MISDEALMLEFQTGSRQAFEELFARYQPSLFGFFRRRLGSPERAEDLTQETFLAIIRGLSRYEPRATVKTYLFSIALRLLAVERRKGRRETTSTNSEEIAATGGTDAVLWVQQAIGRLDSVDRDVLMLREYEQFTYTEIAGLLRIPVNTVRSRLFRARMALRAELNSGPGAVGAYRAGGEV